MKYTFTCGDEKVILKSKEEVQPPARNGVTFTDVKREVSVLIRAIEPCTICQKYHSEYKK